LGFLAHFAYGKSPGGIPTITLIKSPNINPDNVAFFQNPFIRNPMNDLVIDGGTYGSRVSVVPKKRGKTVIFFKKVICKFIKFLGRYSRLNPLFQLNQRLADNFSADPHQL